MDRIFYGFWMEPKSPHYWYVTNHISGFNTAFHHIFVIWYVLQMLFKSSGLYIICTVDLFSIITQFQLISNLSWLRIFSMNGVTWKLGATPMLCSSRLVLNWIFKKHQGVSSILKPVHFDPYHYFLCSSLLHWCFHAPLFITCRWALISCLVYFFS